MKKTFPELELHRQGFSLVPRADDATGGTAMHVVPALGGRPQRSCTCPLSKKKTCDHHKALSSLMRAWKKSEGKSPWQQRFAATVWYRLAQELWEEEKQLYAEVSVREATAGGPLIVTKPGGAMLARWLDPSPLRLRFLERLGQAPEGAVDRAKLLDRLALFQLTEMDHLFAKKGFKSRRQAWEESFWHRLAYHCVREHGDEGRFHPAVDTTSGDFTLRFEAVPGHPVVQLAVPRQRVKAILAFLKKEFPEQEDLAIHPVPLRSLLHVSQTTELDLEIRPMIEALQANGEARVVSEEELAHFRYGPLVYLPDLGLLAEIETPGRERRFKAPKVMRLARSQIPSFLAENADSLVSGTLVSGTLVSGTLASGTLDAAKGVTEEPFQRLTIARSFDRVEITPARVESEWCSLSINYGFSDESVSIADILRARAQDLPYLETESSWIDLNAPAFHHLEDVFGKARGQEPAETPEDTGEDAPAASSTDRGDLVRLSLAQLLRFRASVGGRMAVEGEAGEVREQLDRLLALRPADPYSAPSALSSPLRRYQELGVDWLLFLWENGLAGLLCDDMGLGKTHQAMALMASLRQRGVQGPFLVICPTSVLSHWRTKLRDHAPGLSAAVHHGPQRNLNRSLKEADVLITSYGVLRRDAEALREVPFALAFFDEIQQLKNQATQSYEAARHLTARMNVGLTGTPIENSLTDLKALFDLLLPGYLGTDGAFAERYLKDAAWSDPDDLDGSERLGELRRLTAPFILRRLKASVLDELPEKIEDLQTCSLSEQQVALYREVIEARGKTLTRRIEDEVDKPLPYIHVFAVLSLLKQICNHPALAKKDLDRAQDYASGKWDLYRELLGQALGGGQKVVVFSQYLGMITLMARHLERDGVGHAILTGKSRNRGALIERFNTDPDCRVFLGSLKAGGTGIDLIAGSVVIHYDRWWNAAREDQATDRVHRIGQEKTVQVFKLVTEGTLEEKISNLIDRKRQLMASVVQEDDPTLAKIFTREELLELLRPV